MKQFINSLMFKIIILCAGLVLVSSLTLHYFAFRAAKSSIEYTLGQMALNITRSVNKVIDTDKYADLVETKDAGNEYYSNLKENMIAMKNNTGLEFLYSISRAQDGKYIYVVDGMEAGAEGESVLGEEEDEISEAMEACFQGKETYEFDDSEEWGKLISGYIPIVNKDGEVVGILGADFDANYMVEQLGKADFNIYVAGGFILLFSILLAVAVSYWIVRSLKHLREKIGLIKNGDLTVELEMKRNDEVGGLSKAFQSMIVNMSSMISNIRSHSERAIKDMDSFNNRLEITYRATEEITKIVGDIAQGAEIQVESIEEVESSVRNVFKELGYITENLELVNSDSDMAVREMQEASAKLEMTAVQINNVNDRVDSAAAVIKQLEEKFKEVLGFSGTIASLAKKTNLLALNASIEAASAGEHGRGFSVVASEIKSLAGQSSDASMRINQLVAAVQEEINNTGKTIESGVVEARSGVHVMADIKEYLNKLSGSSKKINTRIKEISAAVLHIEENSRNVLDTTEALSGIAKDLSAGTQQTSAETQEQYAILEEIKNDLANMKAVMRELGNSVDEFKIKSTM